MSRNGSGTYTLPAGNPVVTGTTIESNWANTTLSDIATTLTDSLSRSGQGGMTAALRIADGTQGAPGVGFANETGSGFYRAGTGEVWAVVQGAQTLNLDATGVTVPADKATSIEGTFVFNETGADKDARFEGDNDANLLFIDASTDRVGVGTSSPSNKLTVSGDADVTGNLGVGTASPSSKLTVSGNADVTGDLGVGTSTPSSKLDVYGTVNPRITVSSAAATAPGFTISQSGQTAVTLFQPAGSSDLVVFNSAERMRLDAAGTLGIGKTPDSGQGLLQVAGDVQLRSVNTGQLAGMRNKIINGKMEIAQRGTSFAAVVTGTYTLDRFQWQQAGTGVVTISQQADVPSSNEFQSSLRVAVTTADTSIAAGDIYYIRHAIEGYNVRDLIGKTFTLSFWARSSKTGTHCVSFVNSAANRSFIAEYTINSANTWEFKSIIISGGLITAGTWDWTNGAGLVLGFMLAAGTTWQTTAGAWQTGAFYATSSQVNCLDTIGNIFAITGVQLEAGSVATPFEHRPFGAELALCQRYYAKSYLQSIAPGTASDSGLISIQRASSSSLDYFSARFPVVMRAAPSSVVLYSPSTGASGVVRNLSAATDIAASVVSAGDTGFSFTFTAAAGSPYQFHYSSVAEL